MSPDALVGGPTSDFLSERRTYPLFYYQKRFFSFKIRAVSGQ